MNDEYKNYLQGAKKNKITEHFTMFDVCNSDTAIKKNIDNRPSLSVIKNATLLIKNVLEPLRMKLNKPVNVNCIYRSAGENGVNHAVGGVDTSQHCVGQAADITVQGYTIEQLFNYIKNNMDFDQLIQEGTWIHVSYNQGHNRKQSMRYVNGKYVIIK